MIAGENAEAAGIDGQAFGEAVFGGEVGDQLAVGVGGGRLHVRVEALAGELVQSEVARVGGGAFERRLRDAAQHHDGVVAAFLPEEDRDGGTACEWPAPRPTDVVGEFRHARQLGGQERANDEFPDRMNVEWHCLKAGNDWRAVSTQVLTKALYSS